MSDEAPPVALRDLDHRQLRALRDLLFLISLFQRQTQILEATELELAGGHIAWVSFDDLDPGAGWDVFCFCEWEGIHGLPDEPAARAAMQRHTGQ